MESFTTVLSRRRAIGALPYLKMKTEDSREGNDRIPSEECDSIHTPISRGAGG